MSESKVIKSESDGFQDLVPSALLAFRGMVWTGWLLLAATGVLLLVGLSGQSGQSGFYSEPSPMPFLLALLSLVLAVPFLTAAGIIAGLGKREEPAARPEPAQRSAETAIAESSISGAAVTEPSS